MSVVNEVRQANPERGFATRQEVGKEPFAMRALLVNLMTTEHNDVGDWQNGIVGLAMVGGYEGGDLLLRELCLRISSGPGCKFRLSGYQVLAETANTRY